MFVVRIVIEGEPPDRKAFSHLADARQRFDDRHAQTVVGEFETIALYEVEGIDNAAVAVDAVEGGADGELASHVHLLDFVESTRHRLSRLKIDVSKLTLGK